MAHSDLTQSTLRRFMAEIIDYAGLFPPASQDLDDAVAAYASYRQGNDADLLGSLVAPLGSLDDLSRCELSAVIPWPLSVLIGGARSSDLEMLAAWRDAHGDRFEIRAVECKPDDLSRLDSIVASVGAPVYVEIASDVDPRGALERVVGAGALAKIRCGGVEAGDFPPRDAVARFLATAHETHCAFKATAGLHHPWRARHRMTYEPDSDSTVMHGFLNVFCAAALLRHAGADGEAVGQALDETDSEAFAFDDQGLLWRDSFVTRDDLFETRREFAHSFGSCSFEEPIHDLKKAQLL